MVRDRRRLSPRLRSELEAMRRGEDRSGSLRALAQSIAPAHARAEARRRTVPAVTYPPDLPVGQRRDDILAAIRDHQVVVVCGETGSGKTTQLPKICLELGRGVSGMIGHTQPRRLAARSVSLRIAEELGVPLGERVGYKVRFGDKTGPSTLVKLMTDGILLAETQGDPDLEAYDTIILDEAHERSLNIDFLLGYLKRLLPRRPDLKVVVTSATIDPERFSRHFDDAPIITVTGRMYPVEVVYRPPSEEGQDERDEGMQRHIVDAVDECATRGDGDILVFLSGEREIRETAESLRNHHVPGAPGTKILPLYAKLSADEQMEVFRPHTHRRIVLATNVAETSLTVPGIRFVVDTGVARLNRYSPRTKVQRLEVEPISRSSADQRAGRCGRIGPGVCVRLYAEEDYQARPRYTPPEIVRTNLASVILQMVALNLGEVEAFPFLEAPDSRLVKDGYDTLHELGAVSPSGALTPMGREMARLPIDPRVARMLLAARDEPGCCLADVLVIAAALSVQDPRERPLEKQSAADASHAAWRDARSDFLSLLRLWDWFQDRKRHLSWSKLRKECKESFVSFVRLREWEDIHHQLADMIGSVAAAPPSRRRRRGTAEAAPSPTTRPAPAGALHGIVVRQPLGDDTKAEQPRVDAIHRAVLAGLLSNIGVKGEAGEYTGVRSVKFRIFPGSALFRAGPGWLVAAELVRTSALYARTVGPVEPRWIEHAGAHLLKRSHYDPHWDARTGKVMAFERVTLLGVELAARRRVHYGAIDPAKARELFIQHALVEGDMILEAEFRVHNDALLRSLRDMESRARKPGGVVDPHRVFAFYAARVPADVCSVSQFEEWMKKAPGRIRRGLEMTAAEVCEPGAAPPSPADFPDHLSLGDASLPLQYRCEPGHAADGITLRAPAEIAAHLPESRLAWLVPGYLDEKVGAMLRGLPKEFRRLLPQDAEREGWSKRLPFAKGLLADRVSEALAAAGLEVPREVLERSPIPDYLQMRIEVLDDDGKLLVASRDMHAIRGHLATHRRANAGGIVLHGVDRYTRDNLTAWDFGELPERVELDRFGTRFPAYPGLVDQGRSVALRLFERPENAAKATRSGLRRLFLLDAADEVKRFTHRHPDVERLVLAAAAIGSPDRFRDSIVGFVVDRALRASDPPPRTAAQFKDRSRQAVLRLGEALREACAVADPILAAYLAVETRLSGRHPELWADSLADIRSQLASLVPADFLLSTPPQWLVHLPRFLAAIDLRLQRLAGSGVHRDRERLREITPIWLGYHELVRRQRELGITDARLEEYRWMVEELRVSLFAQELRTSIPVSVKRLHEKWEEIVRA
ncbi:MAG: ATP-dependent RNA helicase HrpA [Leptolyngbya sp. PLA1]|nr:ATP-dependent RNA helicase HrpA [Leptolyngbya sp. PLA1]